MTKPAPYLIAAALLLAAPSLGAQRVPAPDDTRHGMLREAWLGLLAARTPTPEDVARRHCLELPVEPANDRLEGSHGDSLIAASCTVVEYRVLDSVPGSRWATARYGWTSVFTAEDSSRGLAARDTVTEEDVILFERLEGGQVRAAWHERFENDMGGVWRSITPEPAANAQGTLLGVEYCVNGTGGCSQEFLLRRPDGRWLPVWQVWPDQLPAGFSGRLLHGSGIDARTLRGEAGFYGSADPNCCPSERLLLTLALRGDSLVLVRHTVVPDSN